MRCSPDWHPHIHTLVTCGALTEAGEFLALPAFDADALLHAWEEAVYALYLREEQRGGVRASAGQIDAP